MSSTDADMNTILNQEYAEIHSYANKEYKRDNYIKILDGWENWHLKML